MSEQLYVSRLMRAPFHPDRVRHRVQKSYARDGKSFGKPLIYIHFVDVEERFDDVLGSENWERFFHDVGGKTACTIRANLTPFGDGSWVHKTNGAGETNIEGEKGAFSDSFKRAAVAFGVGRYLYTLGETIGNMEIVEKGKYSSLTQDSKDKLTKILSDHFQNYREKPEVTVLRHMLATMTRMEDMDNFLKKNKNLFVQVKEQDERAANYLRDLVKSMQKKLS